MEKDKSIHKTSTGKLFQLIDLEGNPMDHENCIFGCKDNRR